MTSTHAHLPAVLNYLVNTLPVHTLPNQSASSLCLFSLAESNKFLKDSTSTFQVHIFVKLRNYKKHTKLLASQPFTYNGLGIYKTVNSEKAWIFKFILRNILYVEMSKAEQKHGMENPISGRDVYLK